MSDVGRYRRVYPRLWRHPGFRALSETGQRLTLYLLTGPQTNRIGLFCLSLSQAAEDLGVLPRTLKINLTTLTRTFGWRFDSASRVFYVPSWWKWNPPANPNVLRGNLRDLNEIPSCALLDAFATNVATLPETLRQTFQQTFGQTFAKQEQEQDQKQEQDQQPKGGSAETEAVSSRLQADEVLTHFASEYQRRVQEAYLFDNRQRAVDEAVTLLQRTSLDRVRRTITAYFDGGADDWHRTHGYPFVTFCRQFGKYAAIAVRTSEDDRPSQSLEKTRDYLRNLRSIRSTRPPTQLLRKSGAGG